MPGRAFPSLRLLTVAVVLLVFTRPAAAYIDLAATLPRIMSDSRRVVVVEVVSFKRESRGVVLKEVRALKGELSSEPIRHVVAAEGGTIPRQVLTWATPGARAVLFEARNNALVCLGEGWYQVTGIGDGPWRLATGDRPDLPLAYHGSLTRLVSGVERMLAGKETVLTVVAHGADNEAASFDLALNRHNLPGLVRVERIRANMNMPALVMAASANTSYLIGPGPVDEADLPAILDRLASPEADVRAEAADDLRCLGRKAKPAANRLVLLLKDPSVRVRCAAAAALSRIDPADARPIEVLARALDSADKAERRIAARAAGYAGTAAAPLADKLAELLADEDEGLKVMALQAIALIGQGGLGVQSAVTKLLDERDLTIDAADALGRLGARISLKRLAVLLSDAQPAVRWAAVRAMSQIGGDDAKPAVDFMIRTLPKAPEMERYNMMIYLALLGPVARDAATVIRTSGSRNPVLPTATLWAIEPDRTLPWQGGRGFGFGPPGGFGGGVDIGTLIYENYVHELGVRLRPAVRLLATKIVAGTAGNVPQWGYKILSCDPELAIEILAPGLTDKELAVRERAVVGLGYMGSAARKANDALKLARNATSNEREKRLIDWALREVGRE